MSSSADAAAAAIVAAAAAAAAAAATAAAAAAAAAATAAEGAAGLAIAVGQTLPPSVRCLSDQLTRAALSTPLNLAEALGRTGRDRLHHLRIADGSVREAQSAAWTVVASGLGDGEKARQLVAELDQLGALLWGLIRWAGW